MTIQPFEKSVSVGITTKNRWQDLEYTLQKLVEFDIEGIPIIIYDDNSDIPCPFKWETFPLNIELQRFDESKDCIVRRNQIAKAIKTKYYFSLDDDSFPIAGSLWEALKFAQFHENDLFCLGFPIYNPVLREHQSQSLQSQPYQVRSFIGCGHLLHVPHFLELGGYREELIHQGEEMEIAARAFQKGYYCYHFPNLKIHHTASNQGRNWHRMDYYGARNNILWNNWFMPPQKRSIKQLRTVVSRLALSTKLRRWGQVEGMIAGFRCIPEYRSYRSSMGNGTYHAWQKLPYS